MSYEERQEWPTPIRVLLLLVTGLPSVLSVLLLGPTLGRGTQLLLFAVALGAMALVWWVSVLRVLVDAQAVTIKMGPFGERIPRNRLVAWTPTTYRWQEWGGWGLRVRWRRRLYNLPGDGGRAVQLTLDNGTKILVSARDPQAVCRALNVRR